MDMKKKRFRTIGSKLTVLFVLCALVLSAALSAFSYLSSWQEYTDFFSHKAEEMVAIIAANVDGDKIERYLQTGETDAYYAELSDVLTSIKREQQIKYLYLFKPGEHELTYILEVAVETDDLDNIGKMGDTYEYTDLEYKYLVPDVQAKRASQDKIISYGSSYGPGVSAWAPILAKDGRLVAMVEADYSLELVTAKLRDNVLNSVLVSLGLITALIIVLSLISRRIVSKPLTQLTENALSFVNGNTLSEFPNNIRTGDEMQTLCEAFDKMAKDIGQYTRRMESVAADKERIATELSFSRDIQLSLLPQAYPAFPGREEFDVFARLQSAKVPGGDFYDYFLVDGNHLCIVAGGVQGQGIPAALFMVVAKTIIKNQIMTGRPLDEVMTIINERLFESSTARLGVTAFVGILETDNGRFVYVNAGFDMPLLMRKGGSYEALGVPAMTQLAEVERVSYRAMELQLRQGDRLILYSGGAASIKNRQGQPFGIERLRAFLNRIKVRDLKSTVQMVCDEITVYREEAEQERDITVLAVEYNKGDRARAEISVRAREDSFVSVQQFIKRQLTENGIVGQVYARLSITVEEAFTLAASKATARGEITVRCQVDQEGDASSVMITLFYGGNQANPLDEDGAAGDAIAFMRRNLDDVSYMYQDGYNSIILKKRI